MSVVFANRKALCGSAMVAFIVVLAVAGPFFLGDPNAFVGVPLQGPSAAHWFGTTGQGQDVFTQTVAGARPTLVVAALVGAGVTIIGALVGAYGGFRGGRVDDALSLLTNVFLVLPGLPLMVVIAAWAPPGPVTIAAVLVITGWAWPARIIRSQTLVLRNEAFVEAAIVAGDAPLRIVLVELLPNMASIVVSGFIGATVYAVGAQVGLEFLGLGDIGTVTWGTNLYWATNDSALLTGSWWTFVPTGVAIAVLAFGLTLINFGIDEVTNPRLQASRRWSERLPASAIRSGHTPVVPHE